MAKLFYIRELNPDYNRVWVFNKEKDAREEGTGLVDGFKFDEEIEDEYGSFFYSEWLNIKDGLCFYTTGYGDWEVEDMSEQEARELATSNGEASGVFFPARLKSGYGDAYLGRVWEHTNALFMFEGGSIQESNSFGHVSTFEQFVNEKNK